MTILYAILSVLAVISLLIIGYNLAKISNELSRVSMNTRRLSQLDNITNSVEGIREDQRIHNNRMLVLTRKPE